MQSNYPEYITTREAEAYSGLKNLAKRRVQGAHAGPPFIKAGDGKNSKVLYSRRAIDEWLGARVRKSTSEHTATSEPATGAEAGPKVRPDAHNQVTDTDRTASLPATRPR